MNSGQMKAIVFDMDGVLVDSEPLHLLAMQSFLAKFGIEYSEKDNHEFLGRTDYYIATVLIPRYSLDMAPEDLVRGKEDFTQEFIRKKGEARPGVYETLQSASNANISMCVASSATLSTIRVVMDTLSIGNYFSHLCSGDEVEHGKPAPDIYLMAAERIGVPPEDCVAIEDSLNGLKAARAAGMYCVSVPCDATAHQDHSIADLRLASLAQLPLDKLFGYNSNQQQDSG